MLANPHCEHFQVCLLNETDNSARDIEVTQSTACTNLLHAYDICKSASQCLSPNDDFAGMRLSYISSHLVKKHFFGNMHQGRQDCSGVGLCSVN